MQNASCDLKECFLCKHTLIEWNDVIKLHKKTYIIKKGKRLFSEGDKIKGMFFLFEGFYKIHMHWGDHKELIIRFAVSGDLIGARGAGISINYPVSATALTDSRVCFVENQFLEATMKMNPNLTYQLMHFYASELQRAENRMRNLAHMDVKGRIADTLLEMKECFGVNDENQINFSLSRQDIASYAGTTYETVFKLFTEFVESKVITTTGKSICILKPEILQKLAKRITSVKFN